MNAIIIEDNPLHLKGIIDMLSTYSEGVNIVGTANDVQGGIAAISAHNPDLVFLDVELNNESGFEIISSLPRVNFSLIVTTSHNNYAVDAFKQCAIDYLLKPYSPKQLFEAVEKAKNSMNTESLRLKLEALQDTIKPDSSNSKLLIPTVNGFDIIEISNLLYLEAEGNYTKFHTSNSGRFIACKCIKEYDELLVKYNFFRIHKTYLINTNAVKKYIKGKDTFVIMNNDQSLPVSRRKKQDFLEVLGQSELINS